MVSRVSLRRRVRRTILGHRRLLAAVLAAAAVGAALQVLRPPAPQTVAPVAAEPRSLGARLTAAHPGLVPLPVRLPDAGMAGLLEPGDRLTVLATDASATGAEGVASTVAVADGVLVLDVPRSGTAENGVMAGEAGRLVIVGVDASAVEPVTKAAVRSVLTFSWDR